MAEPAQNNIDEQIKQAQQNALQHSAALQTSQEQDKSASSPPPPIPPALPSLPISTPAKATSGIKKKGIDVTMSKLSLFSIALCLIFLGAFTFLGGFFIGVWFASPKANEPSMAMGYYPYDAYQQQVASQQPQPLNYDIPSNYPRRAGYAVQTGVSSLSVPGVPSPLTPFVSATQSAIGEGIGQKVKRELTHLPSPSAAISHIPAPIQMTPHALPSQQPPISRQSSLQQVPTEATGKNSKTSKGAESQGNYMVQLGVYASPENANALVNHLQTLNLISSVKQVKSKSGSPLYYVYSGNYSDYGLALKAASRFAAYNIPGAIVVKTPSNQTGGK